MDIVKTQGLQFLIDAAFDAVKEIFRPNMSLDDVAEKYSPIIDEIIEKQEKNGVKFCAGKFKIAQVYEKNFNLNFELYFQDEAKKWSKIAKTSGAMDAKTWLSPEGWLELKNIKEKIFDVDAPESVADDGDK